MPVIRSVVRSAINDTARKAIVSPWRYFLTFDPVLNSYGELDTAFQPSGDFEIELDFVTTNSATITYFFDIGISNNYLRIDASGAVRFRINNGVSSTTCQSVNGYNDGKLHTIKASVSGGVQTLQIDNDTPVTNGSPVAAQIDFSQIGLGGGAYFDGIISNVKLTDLATPANSRIFPLNTLAGTENSTINTGSVTINNIPAGNRELFTFDEGNSRWVGSNELVTNGTFDTDSDWTKGTGWTISGGELVATSVAAGTATYQNATLNTTAYKYSFNVTEISSGNVSLRIGGTFIPDGDISTSGAYSGVVSSVALSDQQIRIPAKPPGSLTADIDNVSVKRLIEIA